MFNSQRLAFLLVLIVAIACLPTAPATADYFSPDSQWPPLLPSAWQIQSNQCVAYSVPGGRIELSNLFVASRCGANAELPGRNSGSDMLFAEENEAQFSLSTDSGVTWTPYVTNSVFYGVYVDSSTSPQFAFNWNMELRQLGIWTPVPGIVIRESPSLWSIGNTHLMNAPVGWNGYMTSSFFDVFTEISVDGGQSWQPCTEVSINGGKDWTSGGTMRLIGVPEPSTFVLLGIGAFSLLAYAWRRRKKA
jgi:hypothetical protein